MARSRSAVRNPGRALRERIPRLVEKAGIAKNATRVVKQARQRTERSLLGAGAPPFFDENADDAETREAPRQRQTNRVTEALFARAREEGARLTSSGLRWPVVRHEGMDRGAAELTPFHAKPEIGLPDDLRVHLSLIFAIQRDDQLET